MIPGLALLDLVGLFVFAAAWSGYAWIADHRYAGHGLMGVTARHRLRWMAQMLARDNRIYDSTLAANIARSPNFVALTSLIILGGLIAVLGASDRLALLEAATSGSPKFFLGTDSAPHGREAKESACGCAGIFNAPFALESYAAVFEQEKALDKLEAFASEFGPRFYGLPLNAGMITLDRQPHEVPSQLHCNDAAGSAVNLVPFHAGETLAWRLRH